MTTKVEPTVEKWEKYGILPDPNPYGKWVSIKNHNRLVRESVRLAVQEAKAEMIGKIEKMKKPTTEGKGDYTDFTTSTGSRDTLLQWSYNQALDDLLASLKQEEEKV